MQGKRLALYFSLCFVFLDSVLCQSTTPCPLSATSLGCGTYRVLTIATASNSNFFKVNPDGTFSGFVWDLINALKETAGLQLTLTLDTSGSYGKLDSYGNWVGMLGDLINNKTDIVISDMTLSADRYTVMDFTLPFMPYYMVIVSQPNAKLSDLKYAVKDGKSNYNYLKASTDPQAQQIRASIQANQPTSLVQDDDAGIALVKQGGWGYVTDDLYVQDLVKNSYGQVVINQPALQVSYFSMGVQLGSPVLRPLNLALLKLMGSGRLQQLLSKWNFVM